MLVLYILEKETLRIKGFRSIESNEKREHIICPWCVHDDVYDASKFHNTI